MYVCSYFSFDTVHFLHSTINWPEHLYIYILKCSFLLIFKLIPKNPKYNIAVLCDMFIMQVNRSIMVKTKQYVVLYINDVELQFLYNINHHFLL